MFPLPFVQSSPIFCVCYDGWCYHSNNYFTQRSQTTVPVSSVGLLLQLQLQRQQRRQRRQSATRQTAAMKIITTITMTTTKMTITNNDNANNNFLNTQSICSRDTFTSTVTIMVPSQRSPERVFVFLCHGPRFMKGDVL